MWAAFPLSILRLYKTRCPSLPHCSSNRVKKNADNVAAVDKMEELVNKCTDYKNEADAVDEPYDLLRQLEDTLDAGSVKKTLSSKRKALKTLHSSKYVAPISVIADAKESHTINFYEQPTFQCSNTMFSKGRETLGVYMLLLFMVVASM